MNSINDFSNLKDKLDSFDWLNENELKLLEPFNYLNEKPSKNFRLKLIKAFNLWLGVNDDDINIISNIINKLHSASLLMDDVEDNSELRRGIPVAHRIYGVPQTINTANYVYFQALNLLNNFDDHSLNQVINDELINLHRGQGMDLYYRDNYQCPTLDQYLELVNNKTGGLLRLAVKLMTFKSNNDVNLIHLTNLIGISFQIRDDYCNLFTNDYKDNKGFAEDITEGKFSFPLIHAIINDKNSNKILNILKQRTKDNDLKYYVVDYLVNHTHSAKFTKQVLEQIHEQILQEINNLGGNELLIEILNGLKI